MAAGDKRREWVDSLGIRPQGPGSSLNGFLQRAAKPHQEFESL